MIKTKKQKGPQKREQKQMSDIMKKFYIEKAFKDQKYVVLSEDQLI